MPESPLLDDTQPQSPFKPLPGEGKRPPKFIDPNEPPSGGAGCGMMGVIGGVVVLFSIVIVALAGAAGWTTGQREAAAAATATQGETIREQLDRIPQDIASGNTVLLDTRIRYLQALSVPQASEIAPTATALFLSLQPTATVTAAPTFDATATAPPESTAEPTVQLAENSSGGFDLAGIFQQAQAAFDGGAYEDAIDYLNVIIGLDESFETGSVRSLMSRALNARARELYNANQPAAATLLVDRARQYGALEDGLEYESYAATLYLNARAAIGAGYPQAIEALRQVTNLGAGGRYYNEALNLLFDQYVAYGDAWAAQGQYCPAEQQYRNALQLLNSGTVNGKLQNAITVCQNGTPTPDPLLGQPGSSSGAQPIAPIGVPGT
ncbi:MAG: tetratricopeptide repeat protein [bacterium]|nr:tetratricopeptide repeat protein [bacterium]